MAERKGLLFVTMQPPEGLEVQFNVWYDTAQERGPALLARNSL